MAPGAHDPLVALTGATGFVGRSLALALTGRGYRVRALTRQYPPKANAAPEVDWVAGSLENPSSLQRLVEGVDAVIHCAGVVRGASRRSFEETNALGTARIVDEAARQPTQPRFLLISSLAAREPQLSWYAASKLHGERMLRERANGMTWTVFRPTALYGPGDREMRPLFTAMRRGFLPIVGLKEGRVTLLHASDLADAVIQWLEQPVRGGDVFELHDGTSGGYGWPQIAHIAEEVWKRPVRSVHVPYGVLGALAWLNLGLGRLTRTEPMLTPGKVRELRHPSWVCDNTPLEATLAWSPQIDLSTALRTEQAFGA